ILDIGLVAADRRGDVFQLINCLGQRISLFGHTLIESYKLAQAALSSEQLIEGGLEVITGEVAALNRSVNQRAQLAQAFGVAEYFALGLQFLDLAGMELSTFDLI